MLRGDLYQPHFAEGNKWGVEILSGEFKGVFLQLGELTIGKDKQVAVDYHIIKKPTELTEDLDGDLFKTVFQTILDDILREAMEIKNGE
tara:strand:- start:485 stop:751 length:267 start_codon:yes stop_codon:yes gene_type:complete